MMSKYEIFFNRRPSKIIKAHGFYQEGVLIIFRDQNNVKLFVVSIFNVDYIEVLQ